MVVGVKRGSELLPVMREMGLDARPLPLGGKLNPLAWFALSRLAKETGSRVIHTHLSTAAVHGTIAAWLAGVPSVAHVRALNSAFWFQKATRLIAVSQAVKDHLVAQGIPEGRVDVVYNGVDPDRYYLPCTKAEARNRLGLADDALLVGVVGHLTPRKGHAVLLEAFATVAGKYRNAYLLFLGQGDDRERLEADVRRLGLDGRVIFSGFHPDVLPFYAAFDIVVHPAIEGEGLPRALLEGGMLGLPTIGTRLSGVPEIINEGETGFIVPVRNPAAMAERLDQLLADGGLRERMGKAGRERIAATFTIPAMVDGVLASYTRAGVK